MDENRKKSLRKILKIMLYVCLGLIILLFQPKFRKPPLEFQSHTIMLIIDVSFIVAIGLVLILVPFLIKKNIYRVIFSVICVGLFIIIIPISFLITIFNLGNTYGDVEYYVNCATREKVIREVYDYGAFGSNSRLIKAFDLCDGIRWFSCVKRNEMKGIWAVYDENWKFIEYSGD